MINSNRRDKYAMKQKMDIFATAKKLKSGYRWYTDYGSISNNSSSKEHDNN